MQIYADIHGSNSLAVIDGISDTLIGYVQQLPFEETILMICNPADNKIYCTGRTVHYRGVTVIDGKLDEEIVTHELDDAIGLIYNPIDNHIFCGGLNTLIIIDGVSNQVIHEEYNGGGKSYRLAHNSFENTVISANLDGGTAGLFNSNGCLISLSQVGGNMVYGCYNSNNNKIYYIQSGSYNQNSFLSIIDGESNQVIDVIPIASMLRSCIYNCVNNKVYVSDNGNNEVTVIDGQSNSIITTITIQMGLGSVPSGLFYVQNSNKIYCSCFGSIKIIDGGTDQIIATHDIYHWTSDFTYNPINHKVYAAASSSDKLIVIDEYTNNIIAEIPMGDHPLALAYCSNNNKVYCAHLFDNIVNIIDGNTDEIIGTIIDDRCRDIAYSSYSNKIYLTSQALGSRAVTIIDCEQDEIITRIDVGGLSASLLYNPNNNRVYVNTLGGGNGTEMLVNVIDCNTDEICSTVSLEQWQRSGLVSYTGAIGHDMVYNSENNKVYTGNRGFSNVSVVQCYSEEKVLHPGWNWESFPRLKRVGNNPVDAVSVLENIEPFPTEIQFLGENGYLEYSLEYSWVHHELYDIVSTSGYKLWTDNTVDSNLPTPGSRVAPDTPITLIASDYSYQLNWIGYWLPQTQMSNVAFGDEWNNVWSIKAEDYYYHDGSMEYKNGTSTTYPWGPIPMEYGKAYLVRVHNTITDFQWNYSGDNISPPEKSKPRNFTYTDKPDYEAINIVDIDEGIIEIGVFEDDICVGASVVDSGRAQILAYTDFANKDVGELTFQIVYGRGDKQKVNSYSVYDFITGEYVERRLIAGRQEYSIVRLNTGGGVTFPTEVSLSQNCPNPFGSNTTISYALPEESVVEISIYNIRGQRVKAFEKGKVSAGNHSITWNGKDDNSKRLGNGIYFYKLSTGKKKIIKKMLLMR